jgi:hypothetical protein
MARWRSRRGRRDGGAVTELKRRSVEDRIAYLQDQYIRVVAASQAERDAAEERGRRQGWAEAIGALRDPTAWAKWCATAIVEAGSQGLLDIRRPLEAADYLTAAAPTDGSTE